MHTKTYPAPGLIYTACYAGNHTATHGTREVSERMDGYDNVSAHRLRIK